MRKAPVALIVGLAWLAWPLGGAAIAQPADDTSSDVAPQPADDPSSGVAPPSADDTSSDVVQPGRATEDLAPAGELISVQDLRTSPRALLGDEAVIPGYWDVGTSVTFSAPVGDMAALAKPLPETTRLGVSGRVSLGTKWELSGSLSLPPKQSTVTDSPPLFGGSLMGRRGLSRRQSLYAAAGVERLLQVAATRDDGVWGEAAMGWDGRSFMDEAQRWIAFSWNTGLGAGRTIGAGRGHEPWLAEAIAGIGLTGTFSGDGRGVGFTLGSDFRFPLLSGGTAYWAGDMPSINPQTRVDLYATFFVHLATGWSVIATLAYRDRGSADHPETILPVLAGGFDQSTFTIGFTYSAIRDLSDSSKQSARADR
jgi:hypothetical protein